MFDSVGRLRSEPPTRMSLLDELLSSVRALPEAEREVETRDAPEATRSLLVAPISGRQTKAYFSEAGELY